jgi:hypothetical protein
MIWDGRCRHCGWSRINFWDSLTGHTECRNCAIIGDKVKITRIYNILNEKKKQVPKYYLSTGVIVDKEDYYRYRVKMDEDGIEHFIWYSDFERIKDDGNDTGQRKAWEDADW